MDIKNREKRRKISGRWIPIAEIGERLDFIFDPDDHDISTGDGPAKKSPHAFIDFRGVNLENHLDKNEIAALNNAITSMNTRGEENAALMMRLIWLILRFIPLLIIFLLLVGSEFQCGINQFIRIV